MATRRSKLIFLFILFALWIINTIFWKSTLWVRDNTSGKGVNILTSFANTRIDKLRVWWYGEDIVDKGTIFLQKIKYFWNLYLAQQPPPTPTLLEAYPHCDYFLLFLLFLGLWDGYLYYFLHMSTIADRETISSLFRLSPFTVLTTGFLRVIGLFVLWIHLNPQNINISLRRSLFGLYYTSIIEFGADLIQHISHLNLNFIGLIGIVFFVVHLLARWCIYKAFDKLGTILKGFTEPVDSPIPIVPEDKCNKIPTDEEPIPLPLPERED